VEQSQSRGKQLYEAALTAQAAGDFLGAERFARELVAFGEAHADDRLTAFGYYTLGNSFFQRNDGPSAEAAYKRAVEFFTASGERVWVARMMMNVGLVALDVNLDVKKARRLHDEHLSAIRESNEPRLVATALGNLGQICSFEGEYERAIECASESLALFLELDDGDHAAWQLIDLAYYHTNQREYARALECMSQAWVQIEREPNPRWIAWYFDVWFVVATALERWEAAAQLMGFVNRYRDERNLSRLRALLPWLSTPSERLARHLDQNRLTELIEEGGVLTPAGAQLLAQSLAR
jgi:hypothetical protein